MERDRLVLPIRFVPDAGEPGRIGRVEVRAPRRECWSVTGENAASTSSSRNGTISRGPPAQTDADAASAIAILRNVTGLDDDRSITPTLR
ncbi:MAG: hypothetical protein KA200_03065 [Burkholderiales bacterium]|nr:hypothetical protein [Burkholderiales bacterium]